jgi:sigma-E factor negative regulatory protein RseA
MSDEIREQLSALVDDELTELEQPLLVSRLERDADLRDCMARYQLIAAVLRGESQVSTLGVAARVQAALRDDAPLRGVAAAAYGSGRRWLKPLAGLAVAASVALVALFGVSTLRETGTAPVPLVAAGDSAAPAIARVSDTGDEQWDRIEPRIDKRLSGYLVNHNEYAASRGVQGVMPYARVVGFDNDPQ